MGRVTAGHDDRQVSEHTAHHGSAAVNSFV